MLFYDLAPKGRQSDCISVSRAFIGHAALHYSSSNKSVFCHIYTKHNIFNNFLCFASLFAHLSSILNNFN